MYMGGEYDKGWEDKEARTCCVTSKKVLEMQGFKVNSYWT